ncbi:SDR family NAD(P)-dependent oxidoreductase [Kitasatospora sp. NPDC056783]|uniref:SDR family NAD(P)-dependent oxidoreductase n=1 Tax=Kitasatospora sp. NPDC056783 TaxID=3345943 RepID=UPI0036ABACBF
MGRAANIGGGGVHVHDVAVVGVSCRLPGGLNDLDSLWSALIEGRDLVTRMPAERFDAQEFTDVNPLRPGRSYTAAAGVLDDIAGFDAEYFSLSPREAARMDPQQRLLLELAAESLDDAGLAPEGLAGSGTGVFVGVSNHAYGNLQLSRLETVDRHTMTGLATGNTAGRLSHAFDLRGPSLAVDTACSSSLTALHQACGFLASGGGLALAAGVNILIGPHEFVGFAKASMLSPTGRCRTFSAAADGFVRAEGGVVLVLKPLDRALADGDRVHGVIVATGVNSDGRTPGLAQPSARAQAALLRRVYGTPGPDARELLYLEAHGTGTPVGDPLECEAVAAALTNRCSPRRPLPIGSVKTNLGHLESASGLAGLLKAVLVLRHRVLPPSLHGLPVNPAIDFSGLGLAPVTAPVPLAAGPGGLVGVNSFGFGGSNAHAVLAPAPAPPPRNGPPAGPRPVLVSARSPAALPRAAAELADHLETVDGSAFYDLAHTTTVRRGRHPFRTAVVASDARTAAARLRDVADAPPVPVPTSGAVAFVYCGNGAQWAGMGRQLLTAPADGGATDGAAAFRHAVGEVDAALAPLLGWSVLDELAHGTDTARQARTEVAQPLLFAVQVGLTAALAAYGVRPAGVAGHSVGEVAAAHACGALDLAAAARVVAHRSRAQARTAGSGRMAAVGLSPDRAREELSAFGGALEVAAVNSPQDVTVAGDEAALNRLARRLAGQGVHFRLLELDHAFHTARMDPVEKDLLTALDGLRPGPARTAFASTVTGALQPGQDLTARYWWDNVRRPVLLPNAVRALTGQGCGAFVEIGPHPVLGHYLRRVLAADGTAPTVVLPTLTRGRADVEALERTVAALLAAGAQTDTGAFFPVPARVLSLPAYPWQREHHWHGSPDWFGHGCGDGRRHHPLLGERTSHPEPLWQLRIDPSRDRWLADHVVTGTAVLPAAAFAEAALGAGRLHHQCPVQLEDLAVERALPLPFDDPAMDIRLQTSLDAADGTVRIASRDGTGPWRTHARGVIRRLLRERPPAEDLAALRDRITGAVCASEARARAAAAGIAYGPAFEVLTTLRVGDGETLARYALPDPDGRAAYVLHPVLLDGALQAGAPLLTHGGDGPDALFLPSAVAALRVWEEAPAEGWVHVRHRDASSREVCWDVRLLDDQGRVTAEADGCRLRRFEATGTAPAHLTTVLRASPGHQPGSLAPPPGIPAPRDLVRAARHALDGPAWDTERYADATLLADRLAAHFTLRAVRAVAPDAASYSPETLIAAGVLPVHRRLVQASLRQAERAGVLERGDDGTWTAAVRPDPGAALARLVRAHPECATEAVLHSHCGAVLPEVLLGRRDAVALLFDENTRHWVEDYYAATTVTRRCNALAAGVVRELTRHWPAGRPLRVLEVGAGTGGLTAALLDVLPPGRTHYTFTDLSDTFFPRARARFAGHDTIVHRPLDLDRDPESQGYRPGSYDLVVAGNVLHATARLRESTGRVTRLLTEGGHLVAVETHTLDRLLPCFGPLRSFWHTDDPDLRPDSPLLTATQWQDLLTGQGFDAAAGLGEDGSDADHRETDYSVLVARRAADRPRADTRTVTDAPAQPASPAPTTSWIIATERPGTPLVRSLLAALRATGPAPVTVVRATTDPEEWVGHLRADPARPALVLLFTDSGGSGVTASDDGRETLDEAVTRTAVLRAVAQACARLPPAVDPLLWLVTRPSGALPTAGAQPFPPDCVPWAVSRSLANEKPRPGVRRLALEPGPSATLDARRLAVELTTPTTEDEIVLTPAGRFVPRLRELPAPTAPAGRRPYHLRLLRPGLGHSLDWIPASDPPAPGPGELVIEVRAAGLNYRDVLLATGSLPPGAEPSPPGEHSLGLEASGIVTAVGEGTSLRVGERVFTCVPGALSSHLLVPAAATGRMPDGMTFTEAATLPVAFFTVQHSLEHLARLTAGETLLLHGAAGGVGLAALQYAHHVGARIIATAGSPAKRNLLELLGAEHVLDSRTLAFADQVRELTDGEGVDVVLNSLAGEAISRNLGVLRPGGRLVELGKRDIHTGGRLALRAFRNNLSFHAVDALRLLSRQPELSARHFDALTRRVQQGVYRPLPYHLHPAHDVTDAFTRLRRSHHVGKVVVTLDSAPRLSEPPRRLVCDPTATYLVTGGLTGLGAEVAGLLAQRGARHLALLSRRGSATPGADTLVAALARTGATTTAYAADVADPDALGDVLARIAATGHPLRGIVHSAMTVGDALLTELDDATVESVLTPKLRGTLLLDRLSRGLPLEFFVVHSSVSATVGHRAQAAYAAGNLAMEGVVRARRAAGLPGLSIGWGLIGEIGSAAYEEVSRVLERMGLAPMRTDRILAALEDLMTRPHREPGDTDTRSAVDDHEQSALLVGHFDFARLATVLPAVRAPRFTAVLPARDSGNVRAVARRPHGPGDAPAPGRAELADLLAALVARITHRSPERVDRSRGLDALGLDSLMATELVVALQRELGIDLPTIEVINAGSVNDLAHRLQGLLGPAAAHP